MPSKSTRVTPMRRRLACLDRALPHSTTSQCPSHLTSSVHCLTAFSPISTFRTSYGSSVVAGGLHLITFMCKRGIYMTLRNSITAPIAAHECTIPGRSYRLHQPLLPITTTPSCSGQCKARAPHPFKVKPHLHQHRAIPLQQLSCTLNTRRLR